MKATDIMLDLETLSLKPDGAIIAIGLCSFNDSFPCDAEEFLINPQLAIGRRDVDTLLWWQRQDPGVFERMMSGTLSPWEAVEKVGNFISRAEEPRLWANSPSFDVVMLKRLYGDVGREFPVPFYQERDLRTLKSLAREQGVLSEQSPSLARKLHDAKDDAVHQVQTLHQILAGLGLHLG